MRPKAGASAPTLLGPCQTPATLTFVNEQGNNNTGRMSTGGFSGDAVIGTHEHLLTLADATKVLPSINGKRHSTLTLWRWCRKGIRGVHLEYLRVGRAMLTSEESLERFYRAVAEADPVLASVNTRLRQPRTATPAKRQKQIEDAQRRLKEAGY